MKILINSLPKSGTNMLQKCLGIASIPYSGKSIAASSVFGRYELAKKILRLPRTGEVPLQIGLEVPATVSPRWVKANLLKANGYVTGHAAFSKHYHHILKEEGYKVIQVIRHPCAVLVSWANYISEPGYYWNTAHKCLADRSFEERVRFLLYGGDICNNTSLYYRSFKEVLKQIQGWVDSDDVLTIRYEDMVGEQGGGNDESKFIAIKQILRHIGKETDAQLINKISGSLYGGTHTFRKGTIDGWKNYINAELLEEIITELHELPFLHKLNYF